MVLHRYKKRYFFFAGLALAVCFVLVMSQFVWSIEVVGNETVSTAEILQVLDGLGLHKGTFRGSVDARDLKNNALLQLDQLSWLWVDIKGSRATVSVSEKRAAPEILDQSSPCDIVASKAGVIKNFNATAGKSAVEVGQTVLEGQLLISGVVTSDLMPESTPARYTHAARRSVRAHLVRAVCPAPTYQRNPHADRAHGEQTHPACLWRGLAASL